MSSILRSFKIRAYSNGAQRRLVHRSLGATRWLWNTALGIRSDGYRQVGLRVSGNDISRWLTEWKRTTGHEWLADVPATCLTQCLRDQDRAFANFFAKRARYPRVKKKRSAGSLRFQGVSENAWRRGDVRLPKLGTLKLAEVLPEVACPDMVTLTRDAADRYFVSFSVEVEAPAAAPATRTIGVDVGLKHLATFSTGEKVENPRRLEKKLKYLRRQQRRLSRQQKGSRRREKQRIRIARAHANVAAQRLNNIHNLTTRLVRENQIICIEDLNVKGMAKGFSAQAVHDAALSELRRQLGYKAAWYGRTLVTIDRFFPSSKKCSNERCGHVHDELRLDVREWTCPKCGAVHDRDINAAKNLEAEGLLQLSGRDGRDLCVEARGSCPEANLGQVLANEARTGNPTCTRMDRGRVGQ